MSDCAHCGYDVDIRNPSGYCDHLYYPENCKTCLHENGGHVLRSNTVKQAIIDKELEMRKEGQGLTVWQLNQILSVLGG